MKKIRRFEGGNNYVNLVRDPNTIQHIMKNYLKYLIFLGFGTMYAQMGINTTNPNRSSVLDIRPDLPNGNLGVLLPRVTTAQRLNNPLTPAERLLVIDTDLNMFMYYLGGTWYSLNGFKTTVTDKSGSKDTLTKHTGTAVFSTNKLDSNAVIVNGDLELNGKLKGNLTSTGNLTGDKVYGEGTTPVGGIIMWSGSINNIPKGWALCDGKGGRPDLQGRFIVGYDPLDPEYKDIHNIGPNFTDADGTSNGSSTQDAKQVRLLSTQSGLPSHTHEVNDPGHIHSYEDKFQRDETVGTNSTGSGEPAASIFEMKEPDITKDSKTGISINYSISKGADVAVENRPPFYVLAYIIKLNY